MHFEMFQKILYVVKKEVSCSLTHSHFRTFLALYGSNIIIYIFLEICIINIYFVYFSEFVFVAYENKHWIPVGFHKDTVYIHLF